jgi:hypothetical protein
MLNIVFFLENGSKYGLSVLVHYRHGTQSCLEGCLTKWEHPVVQDTNVLVLIQISVQNDKLIFLPAWKVSHVVKPPSPARTYSVIKDLVVLVGS